MRPAAQPSSISGRLSSLTTHIVLIASITLGWTSDGYANKSTASKGSSSAHSNKSEPRSQPADTKPSTPLARADGKTTIFFFDGGLRHDLGTFVQKETVGRAAIVDDVTDIYALGPLFHVGLLFPIANRLRLGGAFGYGFNYTLIERQKGQNNGDPQKTQLGQLITADIRLEWNPHLGGNFSLILAPIATLTAISAGGDLKDITNSLKDSHNTWSGPRLGWAAGGEAGVRYMYNTWLSFKVAAGYAYNMQGLLHATRNGDAADSKRVWRSSASRMTALLGLEAHF